jgi:uroporphyrinogen decarboxylase
MAIKLFNTVSDLIDILTPLPALGVDFTIISNKGPKILHPLSDETSIAKIGQLTNIDQQLPFLAPTLQGLQQATKGKTTLIGFVGAPFTLAAYSVEGGHSKLCAKMKKMCLDAPQLVHQLLDKYTEALCRYASYQIQYGAQVMQVFESWSHHLSEEDFVQFAKPYAERIAKYLHEHHPTVPLVYFANGGSGYLHRQLDMSYDGLSIDWQISMQTARQVAGPHRVLAGNVDPMVLYGTDQNIRLAVQRCMQQAGSHHVLNLGHGVEKDTSEHAVEVFVQTCKQYAKVSV